jgi:hypothetical protein
MPLIIVFTNIRNWVHFLKKNTLVLHRFGEKTKIQNTLKNTLFQLLLITVINLN